MGFSICASPYSETLWLKTLLAQRQNYTSPSLEAHANSKLYTAGGLSRDRLPNHR